MSQKPITAEVAVYLCVLLSYAGVSVAAPQAPNLPGKGAHNVVQNPSVEDADPADANRPAGFTSGTVGAAATAKRTWETPGSHGEKAIAVETMDSGDQGYWDAVVAVKPETEYVLSFRYKCRAASEGGATGGDPLYNRGRAGGPNLELGVVPEDESQLAKATGWSDIGIALHPVGGTWLPVATDWSLHRQVVKTVAGQTRLRVRLKLYCYAQKAWFDEVSVVEAVPLSAVRAQSPGPGAKSDDPQPTFAWQGPEGVDSYVLEYSTSPLFSRDTTTRVQVRGQRFRLEQELAAGTWFWQVGVLDGAGVPSWGAANSLCIGVGPWTQRDTTPPTISQPSPPPGMEAGAQPTIGARFSDEGSGVDASSARITLDSKDVTDRAEVKDDGFTLRPAEPLDKGVHNVAVTVADKEGNVGNRLSWQFGVGTTAPMKRELRNGVLWVNEEPYFPIGMWCYVCTPTDGRFKETALAQATNAGYNTLFNTTIVVETGDSVEDLDILSKYGMTCFLNVTADMKKCDTPASAKAALDRGQAPFRDHPCVLGYWADDPENLDNTEATAIPTTTVAKMENARKVLKEYSPDHPIVYAISNLPRLEPCMPTADVLLAYRYPVPQYHPQMIYGGTLAYAERFVEHRPIWFNSQAFDLGYGSHFHCPEPFRPTPAEMRAMAFHSLVEGVRGYSLYACSLNEEANSEHWKEALRMATEMRYLSPALAAGTVARTVTVKPSSTSDSVYYRELECAGQHTLIAVNVSAGPVAVEWQFDKPTQAAVLFEDRVMSAKSTTAADVFGPFEVHLYRWE